MDKSYLKAMINQEKEALNKAMNNNASKEVVAAIQRRLRAFEEAIPDDCTFEVVSLEEDKRKVVPKMTKVPTKVIELVRKAFSYLGEEAQLVANGEAMTDTDIDYCKKGLSAMRSAIEAFPQFAKDYGK